MNIEFKLEYVDMEGIEKIKPLKIHFISRGHEKEIDKLLETILDVDDKAHRMKEIIARIAALNVEKPNGYKADIEELENEFSELEKIILDVKDTDFFEQRLNIILDILRRNGYKDDKDIMSFEFWENCVNPSVMTDLFIKLRYREQSKKKAIIRK